MYTSPKKYKGCFDTALHNERVLTPAGRLVATIQVANVIYSTGSFCAGT